MGEFINKNKSDIIFILILVLVATMISKNVAILHIRGNSMYPAYEHGNILILKKGREISNDDILVFKSPESWKGNSKNFIKRVVAKQGDKVEITENTVKVNDKYIIYIDKNECQGVENISFTLKENQYFVMGDNVNESNDSASQYCIGNKEYIIEKESILVYGEELLLLGGI